MQFKLAFVAFAACVAAVNVQRAIDPAVLNELSHAIPKQLLERAVQDPRAIEAEFAHGNLPRWYQELPADAKDSLKALGAKLAVRNEASGSASGSPSGSGSSSIPSGTAGPTPTEGSPTSATGGVPTSTGAASSNMVGAGAAGLAAIAAVLAL